MTLYESNMYTRANVFRTHQVPIILKKVNVVCVQSEPVNLPEVVEQLLLLCRNHKAEALQVHFLAAALGCRHCPIRKKRRVKPTPVGLGQNLCFTA